MNTSAVASSKATILQGKYEVKPIRTKEEVANVINLYLEEAIIHNPFARVSIGHEHKEIFFNLFMKISDAVVEDKLSYYLEDMETKELVGGGIIVDRCSQLDGNDVAADKSLPLKIRARNKMYGLANESLIQLIPFSNKRGQVAELFFAVMSGPKGNQHLFKDFYKVAVKVIKERNFEYYSGEATNPYTVAFYSRSKNNVASLFLSFEDFEFEGEKPFANIDFGPIWTKKPGMFAFIAKNEDFVQAKL
eukprot:CAMPEP_0170541794 /NCGR_PEP_ID=MMETSP0211-20121228/1427_1 /TAXON_ID=311385 /ORGANISM="Pseudokeronopsis sp., Strain OXSARD2" /LENGTH=247 /DNA_ID=CAMNT_0010844655 /DNA_START=12 /DNA_END=755 /DNA_ORIENTATION=-